MIKHELIMRAPKKSFIFRECQGKTARKESGESQVNRDHLEFPAKTGSTDRGVPRETVDSRGHRAETGTWDGLARPALLVHQVQWSRVKRCQGRPVRPGWTVPQVRQACLVPRESAEPAEKWARGASLDCQAKRGRPDCRGRRVDRETLGRQGRTGRKESRV
jgi:hypothetical protein